MRVEPALRVVVDTNVWISGFLTRTGAPALVTRWVLETALPVFTPDTFAELRERVWRPKFDRYLALEDRRR
jgi:putative PIN family toxin of toxin-antitoxin system